MDYYSQVPWLRNGVMDDAQIFLISAGYLWELAGKFRSPIGSYQYAMCVFIFKDLCFTGTPFGTRFPAQLLASFQTGSFATENSGEGDIIIPKTLILASSILHTGMPSSWTTIVMSA